MNIATRLLPLFAASAAAIVFSATAGFAEAPASSTPLDRREVAARDAEAIGHTPFPIEAVEVLTDADHLARIFSALRSGDAAEAEILKSKLVEPAAHAAVDWFALRMGSAPSFERVAAFEEAYPDWPASSVTRRRAEASLLAARRPAARVRAFFADRPPATGAGRVALALALKSEGAHADAADLVRQAWREDGFGPELESRIIDEFPDVLGTADHRARMERLLFKENWGAAQRAAGRAGPGYEKLARARLAAYRGGKKAEKSLAEVPVELRSDSSYLFSRSLLLRRQKKLAEAADTMAKAPRDPQVLADGDAWWAERKLIARTLLDQGDAKRAYAAASHHGAAGSAQRIEAEFHAGWIALRFLEDPAAAAKHFAQAADIAATPISVARAAYWQGRAAEAAGSLLDAKRHYRRAADKPITFYGQLARERLGEPMELRRAEPLDGEARVAFAALVPVRALRFLQDAGEAELAIALYGDLAQSLSDTSQVATLAEMAGEWRNARASLAVGKTAVQRGFPLDAHAYPTNGVPEFEPVGDLVEQAMILAIARQESGFNPSAVSSAGARGLMQLMPATAKRTAARFKVGFDLDRLIRDPAYNAKIGAAHLGELMDDWRGSHILAFASYNAGGGNVMKWIKAYGDPRKPGIDAVDWIERIPFSETRNYVQRVMENLTVYRQRFDGAAPEAPRTQEADALAGQDVN